VAEPAYMHLPVALNERQEKLSKQTLAPPVEAGSAVVMLWHALTFLGQQPPAELAQGSLDSFWRWAMAHWRVDQVPPVKGARVNVRQQ
jgi:glutamyl-Q tRNA(Asp) synthetase